MRLIAPIVALALILYCGDSEPKDPPALEIIQASSILENDSRYAPGNLLSTTQASWCEGVEGDGIGQSVTFKLTGSEVSRLFIRNGFFDSRYYSANNRVKELIVQQGEFSQKFTLVDGNFFQPLQLINPLQPGRFTLSIKSVYPGNKWRDTCITSLSLVADSEAGVNNPLSLNGESQMPGASEAIDQAAKGSPESESPGDGYTIRLESRGPGEPAGKMELCVDGSARGGFFQSTEVGLHSYDKKCNAISWTRKGDFLSIRIRCTIEYRAPEMAHRSETRESEVGFAAVDPVVREGSGPECR